jgi:hypothetical protein
LVCSLSLDWDTLLLLWHALIDPCLVWTWLIEPAVQDVALLREVASNHRLSAGILLLGLLSWSFVSFLLELVIKLLSVIKYLQKLIIDFITIELFKDILLVLKLILWLFGLLCSLLLLDHRESIFWLLSFDVLTMGLCTFVFDLVLCRLWIVIRCIYSLWDSIISNRLLSRLRLVNSTDTEAFLSGLIVECFLVIIVQNMH